MSAVLDAINHFLCCYLTRPPSRFFGTSSSRTKWTFSARTALKQTRNKMFATRARDGRRKPLGLLLYIFMIKTPVITCYFPSWWPATVLSWQLQKICIYKIIINISSLLGRSVGFQPLLLPLQSRLFLVRCKTPKYRFLLLVAASVVSKVSDSSFVLFLAPTNQFDSWWLLDAQAAAINHLASVHLHSDRHKEKRIVKRREPQSHVTYHGHHRSVMRQWSWQWPGDDPAEQ